MGASVVFFSLMFFGAVFTIISLLFGHDSDGGDGGDGDSGDLSGDSEIAAEAPSKFSIRMLLLFITGFGALGFATQLLYRNVLLSSGTGLLGGVVMAIIGYSIVMLFYKQQATSILTSEELIGKFGETITIIPKDGIGEISLVAMEKLITKLARSEDGSEIKSGTRVKVTSIDGMYATVKKLTNERKEEKNA